MWHLSWHSIDVYVPNSSTWLDMWHIGHVTFHPLNVKHLGMCQVVTQNAESLHGLTWHTRHH